MPRTVLLVVVFMLAGQAAQAEEVPRLDIESTCRAASPVSSADANPYQNCMRSEQEARTHLEQRWTGFKDASRRTCTQETHIGGSPSYVEVLTCLEMAEGKFLPGGSPSSIVPQNSGTSQPRRP